MNSTRLLAASALTLLIAAPALACDKHSRTRTANELKHFGAAPHATPRPSADTADTEVPLWDTPGTISFRITTGNELAQTYFDQGLMLAYGFNHAEARRSFQAAQRLDPGCAMCFWGEALVLGPNINAPMDSPANAPALAAIGQAKALAARGSRRSSRPCPGDIPRTRRPRGLPSTRPMPTPCSAQPGPIRTISTLPSWPPKP